MVRFCNRSRSGSDSYPASAITRLGFCCGRPFAQGDSDFFERGFRKHNFCRRCTFQPSSQRKTLTVDQYHPLRTLAPLGFSDPVAPFFAVAKLPSMNASLQSSRPLRFSSPRNVRQIVSQTSFCSQFCNLRQHVEGEGYSLGRSCHLAPLRAIHRIPSSTWRLSAQGRPPRFPRRSLGNRGSIFLHCRSVSIAPPRGIYLPSCHVMDRPLPHFQVPDSSPDQVMKQLLEESKLSSQDSSSCTAQEQQTTQGPFSGHCRPWRRNT